MPEGDVFIADAEEGPVQEGEEAAARVGKIDRRGKDKAVRLPGLLHKFVHAVTIDDALAFLSAGAALQTVGQGFGTSLDDFGLYAFLFKDGNHFIEGHCGGAMHVAAAIHKKNFHGALLQK